VNKTAIEALVKCGALDSTGATRTGMLEVFPQAQGAGAKAQQDALLGQSSIFDLDPPSDGGGAGAGGQPDPPVPALPDDRSALNAWEKETLGLFLSSHPLKEVRAAFRARVDCSLADLRERRDGDLVTVGGMVTEAKRIRTRKGDPMMFATLDDLEGSVEMVVFNSAFEDNADRIDTDRVLIVKGRVDQKEAGEVKLVVNEVEPFEPSAEEVAAAEAVADVEPEVKRLTVSVSSAVPEGFLDDLKDLCANNPGDHELRLVVGARTLVLGPEYRVAASGSCLSELEQLPGAALVA
jgi:DNA polymerase-3 subunit alpha